MDNDNRPERGAYDFLEAEDVERSFADINYYLLSGRHLSAEDGRTFSVLDEYTDEFSLFYKMLYKLNLKRQVQDGTVFYYLDFFDGSKGKLSDVSRHIKLTQADTIIGLTLLKFYESRILRETKRVYWQDIKQELTDGEYREYYRQIFLHDLKTGRTEKVWEEARATWLKTLAKFSRLGWILLIDSGLDNFQCEIKPSIHRLAIMYSDELSHFDEFIKRINLSEDKA